MTPPPLLALGLLLLVPLTARAETAGGDPLPIGSYGLDELPRTIAPRGKIRCPKVEMVTYKGDVVRYHSPVRVYAGFVPHLRRFEEVVRDVAIEVYGRAPLRIRHIGTYNCRRISAWPDLLSEHGLGNAIDVLGFRFGRLPRGAAAPEGLPRRLRGSFEVRLADHWGAEGTVGSYHARFLDLLARRLVERGDVFRVLLGPAYPGHDDHFHFDIAPYRLVEIWEDERAP